MSRVRLFVAVLPPASAAGELHRAVEGLRALPGAERLRWTGEAVWHYTLAFLGSVDAEVLPGLRERLARAARRTEPFPLCVHRGGRFGGRVLWAGAAGDLGALRLLAARAGAAARRAGVPVEDHHRYTPHLTLARSRDEIDMGPYVAALSVFEGTPWEVGEIALVQSRLPVDGVPGEQPRYQVGATWALGR